MNGVKFYCEEVYRRNDSSSTTRVWRRNFASKFECSDGLPSRNRRKRLQELVERVSDFKIVEEILHGNARADKDGHAALNVRIAVNDGLLHTMAPSTTLRLGIEPAKPLQELLSGNELFALDRRD